MNKKKWILSGSGVVLLCCILTAVFRYWYQESKKITGDEWFQMQEQYIEDFETYADTMDMVVALYISGSISDEDMATHVQMLREEYDIMKLAYQKEQEEHPVKTGTYTYVTKRGCEAIADCFETYFEILDMLDTYNGDIEAMSYNYVAFMDILKDEVAEYMAARTLYQ